MDVQHAIIFNSKWTSGPIHKNALDVMKDLQHK